MKLIPIVTVAALASLALAGCDRPGTKSSMTTTPGTSTTTTVTTDTARSAPTTADTSSPNTPATTASTSPSATGASSGNVVSDTIVTGKVKAAITAETGMKDSDISVKTENGLVTLTGTVKSEDQVTLASALAQRQEGVNRVENQVAVQ